MTPAKKRAGALQDTPGHDELSSALDYMAHSIKLTGNRKLLPIYERLER